MCSHLGYPMRCKNTDLTIRRRSCVVSEALPPCWLDPDASPMSPFSPLPAMILSMLLLFADGPAIGSAEGKVTFVVAEDDEEGLWDAGDSYCTAGTSWRKVNIAAGVQQRWDGQKRVSQEQTIISFDKKEIKDNLRRYLI